MFRYKETFFRSKEAVTAAKSKLIDLVMAEMDPGEEQEIQEPSSSLADVSDEDLSTSVIVQISKKIRLEKRLEVCLCVACPWYHDYFQVSDNVPTAVTVQSVVTDYLSQPEEKLECLR